MSGAHGSAQDPPAADGSTTAPGGTPLAVDVSRERRARVVSLVLLAGPLIWSLHFLVVYTVAEAGCTGDGPGLALFDPPVPTVVTLVATAVAAVACVAAALWAQRRRRALRAPAAGGQDDGDQDPGGALALAGALLSWLSLVAVLFGGLPALVLGC
jgi:AcrR family transcriptional regulator